MCGLAEVMMICSWALGTMKMRKKEALLSPPPTAPAANQWQAFYFGPEATIASHIVNHK
jgi:hypothetical protein